MRQVSELTGVPENTIRSWERRFGLPRPERSGGNQRRYSERDAGIIRAIQGARDRGRTMEQAIADVAPDGSNTRPSVESVSPEPVSAPSPPPVIASGPTDDPLVDSLLGFDESRASAILADRLWRSNTETICVEVLLPAWQAIDRRLALGYTSATLARFGQSWVERKLQAALDQSIPARGRQHVIVGAMHDRSGWLESLCFAIVLARAGYEATWLGDNVPVHGVLAAVEACSPDALMLVGNSDVSRMAIGETANRLGQGEPLPAWAGLLAVNERVTTTDDTIAIIPLHATQTAAMFDRALRPWTMRQTPRIS